MRLSQYPIHTLKETPAEAEVPSHQLMLRAGLIRRVATGLYSWLPMGLRVLRRCQHRTALGRGTGVHPGKAVGLRLTHGLQALPVAS